MEKLSSFAAAAISVESAKPALSSSSRSNSINNKTAVAGNVRVLELHEWKEAALALAEAFSEDHSCMYFLETPDTAHWTKQQQWDLHLKMMEYITYAHLLKGLVVSAGPHYDCIGLFMPPGENMYADLCPPKLFKGRLLTRFLRRDDWITIFRSGMWRLNWQLSTEGKKRFFDEFLPLLHDTKAQVLAERDDDSW